MCNGNRPGTAKGTVLIENDRTRVTQWRFSKQGDDTGWHCHEFDYVVVPLFDGSLRLDEPGDMSKTAELKNGIPYFRNAGVEHNVINPNDFGCAFVEIEFLDQ